MPDLGVGVIDVIDTVFTGGTTILVVTAAVALTLAVVAPRLRRWCALPAALLALAGAIGARFTQAHTSFGDAVFRGDTVQWSLLLALTAVLWWFFADLRNNNNNTDTGSSSTRTRTRAEGTSPPSRAAATTASSGTTVNSVAVLDPPQQDQHRRNATPRSLLRVLAALTVLLIATATFLTASGLYPVGLALLPGI